VDKLLGKHMEVIHSLLEANLDLKESDFIILPPNLKGSVERPKKK
jgi:hypothetical protein